MPSYYTAVRFINVLALKSPQVGRTLFKKICRRHDISHWPQNPKKGKRKAEAPAEVELKLTRSDAPVKQSKHATKYMRGPSIAQPHHESSIAGALCMSLSKSHKA